MEGTARWLREIPLAPPSEPGERPYVVQHLFKVTPPMEWTDHVAFRHGKLIKDPRRGLPNRVRVGVKNRFSVAKPRYTYAYRVHRTSFVLASASDLKTFMEASRVKMRDLMRERGDKAGERLFSGPRDEFEVETYLFPTDKFGNWKDGGELPGSQRGTLDHRVPFQDVGYRVVGMPVDLTVVKENA